MKRFLLSVFLSVPAMVGCKTDPSSYCTQSDKAAYMAGEYDCDLCPNPADPSVFISCETAFGLTGVGDTAAPDTGSRDTDTDTDTATADDVDGDGVTTADGDCDDGNAAVNPSASETCNDRDDNCDGAVDEGAGTIMYRDSDDDGYGTSAETIMSCTGMDEHYSVLHGDCDDLEAEISPAADEVCDGVDNDCDGAVDTDPVDGTAAYRDADGDGWGAVDASDSTSIVFACEVPEGFSNYDGDCNDGDADYHPSAAETDCADPEDYNCDGAVGYEDADGDLFAACEECDDNDPAVNPAADEYCDRVDNDCDGRVDTTDAVDAREWRADADGDGFGDETGDVYPSCTQPAGRVEDATDCEDHDPAINPDADEVCDTLDTDEDCDGVADDDDVVAAVDLLEWYSDIDRDGYGDPARSVAQCEQPAGYVANSEDCDDYDNSEPAIDACE